MVRSGMARFDKAARLARSPPPVRSLRRARPVTTNKPTLFFAQDLRRSEPGNLEGQP
jgi:hypothetical protein